MKNNLTLSYIDGAYDKHPKLIEDLDEFLSSAVRKSCGKKQSYGLLPFIANGRTKNDFTSSNVIFIDVDDKKDFRVTRQIFAAPDYFMRIFPEVFFIQKSRSGATHIVVGIDEQNTADGWKECVDAYYMHFCNKFEENYGKLNVMEVLDSSMKVPTQVLFINDSEIILNKDFKSKDEEKVSNDSYKSNESIQDRNNIQESPLKSCGFLGNVTDCESDINLLNKTHDPSKVASLYTYNTTYISETATFEGWSFENNVTVPYCDNQIVLDFSYTKKMLNKILDYVIDHYKDDIKCRITLYRPAIYDEGVYSVKLKLFRQYGKDGAVKIRQGGMRRLNIKKAVKVAVLNYIASVNHGNKSIKKDNIIATIKHYILNHIELNGRTRYIDDDMVIRLIKELKNNWDSIKIEYSVNSFWYKRDKDEDNVAYMVGLKRRRNAAIDSTAKSFIEANCLGGLGYGKIAELLNLHSVASKTKNGWSEFSVGNIFRKDSDKPESEYKNRIDELIDGGYMYKDIAETLNNEGFLTKQGKEFNAKSIENYVKRKLKK